MTAVLRVTIRAVVRAALERPLVPVWSAADYVRAGFRTAQEMMYNAVTQRQSFSAAGRFHPTLSHTQYLATLHLLLC